MPDFIYLASQSPRRRQLLEQLGVRNELLLPNVDGAMNAEDAEAIEAVLPGESPGRLRGARVTALKLDAAVARCARRGACPQPHPVFRHHGRPRTPPFTANRTTPSTPSACWPSWRAMTHRVLTAVAVQVGQAQMRSGCRRCRCRKSHLRRCTPEQIAAYVATGEPMGKAGAYGIQGRAAAFIPVHHGSYSGIMGLPMYETAQLLRAAGFAI
jgi:septum formation protein